MARTVILIPEAVFDVGDAYWWYEEQQTGLGEQFLECLEVAYAKICQHPERYPIRFDTFRRILIRCFPYAVYFEHTEECIWVYYVFHCSQDPEKLAERLLGS